MLLLIREEDTFTYVGGGPGSSVYKSTDAGISWRKLIRDYQVLKLEE